MHETYTLKTSKEEAMVIKIDIQKAYDGVSWKLLDQILDRFGLQDQWRTWVQNCISTVTFFVLINGDAIGFFNSSKGLRQGDPPITLPIYHYG